MDRDILCRGVADAVDVDQRIQLGFLAVGSFESVDGQVSDSDVPARYRIGVEVPAAGNLWWCVQPPPGHQIGRASCRERGETSVGEGWREKGGRRRAEMRT